MEPTEVTDDTTLMEYMRQRLGCPSFAKDTIVFRTRSIEFRTLNPHIDYADLVRVVDWCKATRRRPPTLASIFGFVVHAYQAGILTRVESHREKSIMDELYGALEIEKDPEWRGLIMNSSGSARGQVLAAWRARRSA